MAKLPTYKQAQSIIMDALEQYGGWKVEHTSAQGKSLKIPHATLRPYRLYFKSQSIYLTGGPPPYSLNDARSMHVDPREVAMQPPERIHTIIRRFVDHYGSGRYTNPRERMIGAGFEGAWQFTWIETQKGWQLLIEDSFGRTYWPVQTSSGAVVGFEDPKPKRGAIPSQVLRKAQSIYKKGWKHYRRAGNPMPGVPGGSISACIEEMKTRKGVVDPGALCGWIARERGESRKRKKNGKNKKVSLRGVMGKALR